VALWLLALPPMLLGFMSVLGVGLVREGPPLLVSVVAGAVVLLPAAGIVAPFKEHRFLGLPVVAALWSVALVAVFPVYFPGERDDALAAGAAVLGAAVGLQPEPATFSRLDGWLPGLEGRAPAPPAAPPAAPVAPPPAPPPVVEAASDAVVLPYEGSGATLSVPVALEGRRAQDLEVSMIFDTGATLTTLNRATLRLLGVDVPADAPQISFQTANGERTSSLVMLDRLWLGGLPVDGVTVGLCEPCANDEDVGLLGLNVSRRFLVTVDQARQELILQPRGGPADAGGDVRYWVELTSRATRWPDGRMEVEVSVENLAPRDIEWVDVEIACGEPFTSRVESVARGETRTERVSLPLGTACDGYTVAVGGAAWGR
jgi:hypothetical protein